MMRLSDLELAAMPHEPDGNHALLAVEEAIATERAIDPDPLIAALEEALGIWREVPA